MRFSIDNGKCEILYIKYNVELHLYINASSVNKQGLTKAYWNRHTNLSNIDSLVRTKKIINKNKVNRAHHLHCSHALFLNNYRNQYGIVIPEIYTSQ